MTTCLAVCAAIARNLWAYRPRNYAADGAVLRVHPARLSEADLPLRVFYRAIRDDFLIHDDRDRAVSVFSSTRTFSSSSTPRAFL